MELLECPYCKYRGVVTEFEVSLADECFCPKCDGEFLLREEDEDG